MKKHKILNKKRLMKNMTSVMSILVVAFLVFSSAVSALNTSDASKNMNVENKCISIPEIPDAEITLMAATQATPGAADSISFNTVGDYYKHTSSPKTTGLQDEEMYNNTFGMDNLGSSQDDTTYNLFSECADDFILETAGYVTTIHFIAGYWNPIMDGNFDWRVYFYDDDGSGEKPAEEAFAVYEWPNDLTNEEPLGSYYYDYWCYLEDIDEDPLFLTPETKYWMVVQGVGDISPQSGYAMHTDPILLKESCFRSAYFGYPNWVPASSVFGTPYDHCFAIWGFTSTPEHDVAIRSINKPESGPAVPENPMQVTIKNWGNNTETFEAQMNIIRCEGSGDYLLSENFSGTFPPENWTTDYWKKTSTYGATDDPAFSPEASVYRMDQYPYQDNYIMSPPVNASGWEKVNLKFAFGADIAPGYSCTVYLRYRKNDTSKWEDLTPWENPISADFHEFYEIGCFGFGEDLGDEYQFKFEYIGYYYQYYYFYLDEVTLEGCAGCAEYAEICEEPITLDAGEEIDVDFPDWVSTNWQDPESENSWIKYPVQAFTMLEGDENPWNDNKWKLADIYYPWMDDVAPIDLSGPATGPAQIFNVDATVKNVGQNTECCFKTYVEIAEVDYADPQDLFYDDFINGYYYYNIPGWTVMPPTSPYAWYCYPYYNYLYMIPGTYQPNLQLRYYYANPSACIRSDPFDTSSAGVMEMDWAMYYRHGSGDYDLYVEVRSNPDEPWAQIQPWDNPVSGGMDGDMYNCDATIGIGLETQIQLRTAGNYYNMRYWYHDNIKFTGYEMKEPEHEDEMCIMELEAGDTIDFNFGTWTPEFLAEETTGERNYIVRTWTDLNDPQDRNPANDILQFPIKLQFFHDVGVKEVTSPSSAKGDRDVLFSQYPPYQPDESWAFVTSSSGLGYLCHDDFWDVEKKIGAVEWWGMSAICCWQNVDPDDMEFEVIFYEAGSTPGAVVDTFSGCLPNFKYYLNYAGYDTWHFYYELPYSVELAEGWISIQSTYHPGNGNFLWACGPTGNFNMLQNGANTGRNAVFNLTSTGPGVYVPLGVSPIEAIVENIGTFSELDLTCYAEIYEYITNCSNPTLDYEDNITNIDLDVPLGGTETLSFDDYDFDVEGVYDLFLDIPLEISPDYDMNPNNNQKKVFIGADGTPPISSHSLVPATPDGEDGWYVSDVEVTLDASDPEIGCGMPGSEVNRIMYKIGTAGWQTIPGDYGTFTIDVDGNDIPIQYYAVDNVGNEESTHSFTIDMDQTVPAIEAVEWEAFKEGGVWMVRFTCNATDAMSGMDRVVMYINDGFHEEVISSGPGYEFVVTWTPTFETVTFKWEHYDIAGWHTDDTIDGKDVTAYPYPYQQYPYPHQQQQQQQQPLGS